jgi:hypothetical protein
MTFSGLHGNTLLEEETMAYPCVFCLSNWTFLNFTNHILNFKFRKYLRGRTLWIIAQTSSRASLQMLLKWKKYKEQIILKKYISLRHCVSNLGICPPQYPSFLRQWHFIGSQLERFKKLFAMEFNFTDTILYSHIFCKCIASSIS